MEFYRDSTAPASLRASSQVEHLRSTILAFPDLCSLNRKKDEAENSDLRVRMLLRFKHFVFSPCFIFSQYFYILKKEIYIGS